MFSFNLIYFRLQLLCVLSQVLPSDALLTRKFPTKSVGARKSHHYVSFIKTCCANELKYLRGICTFNKGLFRVEMHSLLRPITSRFRQ